MVNLIDVVAHIVNELAYSSTWSTIGEVCEIVKEEHGIDVPERDYLWLTKELSRVPKIAQKDGKFKWKSETARMKVLLSNRGLALDTLSPKMQLLLSLVAEHRRTGISQPDVCTQLNIDPRCLLHYTKHLLGCGVLIRKTTMRQGHWIMLYHARFAQQLPQSTAVDNDNSADGEIDVQVDKNGDRTLHTMRLQISKHLQQAKNHTMTLKDLTSLIDTDGKRESKIYKTARNWLIDQKFIEKVHVYLGDAPAEQTSRDNADVDMDVEAEPGQDIDLTGVEPLVQKPQDDEDEDDDEDEAQQAGNLTKCFRQLMVFNPPSSDPRLVRKYAMEMQKQATVDDTAADDDDDEDAAVGQAQNPIFGVKSDYAIFMQIALAGEKGITTPEIRQLTGNLACKALYNQLERLATKSGAKKKQGQQKKLNGDGLVPEVLRTMEFSGKERFQRFRTAQPFQVFSSPDVAPPKPAQFQPSLSQSMPLTMPVDNNVSALTVAPDSTKVPVPVPQTVAVASSIFVPLEPLVGNEVNSAVSMLEQQASQDVDMNVTTPPASAPASPAIGNAVATKKSASAVGVPAAMAKKTQSIDAKRKYPTAPEKQNITQEMRADLLLELLNEWQVIQVDVPFLRKFSKMLHAKMGGTKVHEVDRKTMQRYVNVLEQQQRVRTIKVQCHRVNGAQVLRILLAKYDLNVHGDVVRGAIVRMKNGLRANDFASDELVRATEKLPVATIEVEQLPQQLMQARNNIRSKFMRSQADNADGDSDVEDNEHKVDNEALDKHPSDFDGSEPEETLQVRIRNLQPSSQSIAEDYGKLGARMLRAQRVHHWLLEGESVNGLTLQEVANKIPLDVYVEVIGLGKKCAELDAYLSNGGDKKCLITKLPAEVKNSLIKIIGKRVDAGLVKYLEILYGLELINLAPLSLDIQENELTVYNSRIEVADHATVQDYTRTDHKTVAEFSFSFQSCAGYWQRLKETCTNVQGITDDGRIKLLDLMPEHLQGCHLLSVWVEEMRLSPTVKKWLHEQAAGHGDFTEFFLDTNLLKKLGKDVGMTLSQIRSFYRSMMARLNIAIPRLQRVETGRGFSAGYESLVSLQERIIKDDRPSIRTLLADKSKDKDGRRTRERWTQEEERKLWIAYALVRHRLDRFNITQMDWVALIDHFMPDRVASKCRLKVSKVLEDNERKQVLQSVMARWDVERPLAIARGDFEVVFGDELQMKFDYQGEFECLKRLVTDVQFSPTSIKIVDDTPVFSPLPQAQASPMLMQINRRPKQIQIPFQPLPGLEAVMARSQIVTLPPPAPGVVKHASVRAQPFMIRASSKPALPSAPAKKRDIQTVSDLKEQHPHLNYSKGILQPKSISEDLVSTQVKKIDALLSQNATYGFDLSDDTSALNPAIDRFQQLAKVISLTPLDKYDSQVAEDLLQQQFNEYQLTAGYNSNINSQFLVPVQNPQLGAPIFQINPHFMDQFRAVEDGLDLSDARIQLRELLTDKQTEITSIDEVSTMCAILSLYPSHVDDVKLRPVHQENAQQGGGDNDDGKDFNMKFVIEPVESALPGNDDFDMDAAEVERVDKRPLDAVSDTPGQDTDNELRKALGVKSKPKLLVPEFMWQTVTGEFNAPVFQRCVDVMLHHIMARPMIRLSTLHQRMAPVVSGQECNEIIKRLCAVGAVVKHEVVVLEPLSIWSCFDGYKAKSATGKSKTFVFLRLSGNYLARSKFDNTQ